MPNELLYLYTKIELMMSPVAKEKLTRFQLDFFAMAARYTTEEVLEILSDFGLSESDSDGEDDTGVSSYLNSNSLDLGEVEALGRAVDSQQLVRTASNRAPSSVALSLLDSMDEGEVEEDFQGDNSLYVEKQGLVMPGIAK